MCLTLEALIVFFNIIGPEIVTREPDRFIVHAEQGDTHWVQAGSLYCTKAPQRERKVVFDGGTLNL